MSRSGVFAVIGLAAVGLVIALGAYRVAVGEGSAVTPDVMVPFLVASAALCVVGLTMRTHPTIAWLALIVALTTVTVDLASFGRDHRADLGAETWRWVALTIVLSAICATSAAVAYATDPARRVARPLRAAGVLMVLVLFGVGAWALATPDPDIALTEPVRPLGDLVLVTRAFLITTIAFVVVGILGDLRPAVDRTTRRMASIRGRPRRPADAPGYAAAWIRTFGEELTPGRAQERRAAIAERARIARDLHAVVVPDLRRALREAENVGSVDRLAASLRDALRQVEAMVETRDAIGLEIGGLVTALESLVERVEDRSDVRVTIDVAESDGQPPASPPPHVAAAALRIAALALENVVRHAPSAQVRIVVSSRPDRVGLSIEDDGPGLSPGVERAALEDGRRGLADMVTEAALCGASLRSGLGAHGSGMVVAFDWPAS